MENAANRLKSFEQQNGEVIENDWLKKELVDMGVFCRRNGDVAEKKLRFCKKNIPIHIFLKKIRWDSLRFEQNGQKLDSFGIHSSGG